MPPASLLLLLVLAPPLLLLLPPLLLPLPRVWPLQLVPWLLRIRPRSLVPRLP
jgi:hypothetical protein